MHKPKERKGQQVPRGSTATGSRKPGRAFCRLPAIETHGHSRNKGARCGSTTFEAIETMLGGYPPKKRRH